MRLWRVLLLALGVSVLAATAFVGGFALWYSAVATRRVVRTRQPAPTPKSAVRSTTARPTPAPLLDDAGRCVAAPECERADVLRAAHPEAGAGLAGYSVAECWCVWALARNVAHGNVSCTAAVLTCCAPAARNTRRSSTWCASRSASLLVRAVRALALSHTPLTLAGRPQVKKLRYFVANGALLGLERHRYGVIPWEKDADMTLVYDEFPVSGGGVVLRWA